MLSDQKVMKLICRHLATETRKATKGHDVQELIRAVEQAVIAEQAAPAGEAVGKVVAATGSLNDVAMIQWISEYRPKVGDSIYATTQQPAECDRCAELAQDLQTTADVLAEYVESHRNIELAHANQYEILCRRTDEVIKSEQAWQQLDDDRVEYINDVGDILGQNDTDESLLNAAKRVMATIEFQKKAWEADFIRMTRMEAAIERMRVAGGKDEFWNAFELAKDLL